MSDALLQPEIPLEGAVREVDLLPRLAAWLGRNEWSGQLSVKSGDVELGASYSQPRYVEGNNKDVKWPRDLGRLKPLDLHVKVGGLEDLGQYSGKLIIAAEDRVQGILTKIDILDFLSSQM